MARDAHPERSISPCQNRFKAVSTCPTRLSLSINLQVISFRFDVLRFKLPTRGRRNLGAIPLGGKNVELKTFNVEPRTLNLKPLE
jgi:hypothetical protein